MTTTRETPTIDQLLVRKRDGGYKSEAARAIGVSRQIYDTWESGHHVPGDDWVGPLMDYLGMDELDVVMTLYRSRKSRQSHNPRTVVPDWSPRPMDVDAEIDRLMAGIGHPGREAA